MSITVHKQGTRWVARFPWSLALKDRVKASGFRFDSGSKTWYTHDARTAAKFDINSPDIAAEIRAEDVKRAASLQASRAVTSSIEIPSPETLAYLPFQKAGIEFALQRKDVLIADQMGLGKTIQALGIINADSTIFSALVVCPASLKLNWQREARLWLTRGFAIIIASSKPSAQICKALIGAFSLAHEIRTNSCQKRDDVHRSTNVPSELRLGALDTPARMDGSPVYSSAMPTEKFNHTSVSIGERHNPSKVVLGARAVGGNPPFPVNDASHVGQGGNFMQDDELRGVAANESHRLTDKPHIVVAQSHPVDAKLACDYDRLCAILNELARCEQLSIAYSGRPPQGILLILNYEIVKDWRLIVDKANLDLACFDEIHYLKNPKAQRTLAILGQWSPQPENRIDPITAKRRVCLSGTPILNRPAELWTLVRALDRDGLGENWKYYHSRYCAAHKTRYGWDVTGASHLDELQAKLRATIMVRRLKSDVLTELPAKRRQILTLIPEGAQAKAAVAREQQVIAETEARLNGLRAQVEALSVDEASEAYKQAAFDLRQAYSVAFEETSLVRHEVALAKLPQAIAHIEDCLESEAKLVVFCHHHDCTTAIVDSLKAYGAIKADGRDSIEQRQEAVDRFQNSPQVRVLVCGIHAMGVGHTLTAASHVVFAELDWTPGILQQAEDRLHRIGQRNQVLVQHIVLDGSLDARMAELIVSKMGVIAEAMDATPAKGE